MGCDVCIGGDISNCDFTIYDVEDVVVSSDEACVECRGPIAAGETAQSSEWSDYEGSYGEPDEYAEPDIRYTCLPCAEIRAVYSCGESEIFGQLWESMRDNFTEIRMAGECWDKLSAPAKAKLLEEWRKWKGLR